MDIDKPLDFRELPEHNSSHSDLNPTDLTKQHSESNSKEPPPPSDASTVPITSDGFTKPVSIDVKLLFNDSASDLDTSDRSNQNGFADDVSENGKTTADTKTGSAESETGSECGMRETSNKYMINLVFYPGKRKICPVRKNFFVVLSALEEKL